MSNITYLRIFTDQVRGGVELVPNALGEPVVTFATHNVKKLFPLNMTQTKLLQLCAERGWGYQNIGVEELVSP